MKLAVHINSLKYIYDYKSLGVELFIVGGQYAAQSLYKANLEDIKILKDQCSKVYVMMNGLYDNHELKDINSYIDQLHAIEVDGILFQDFGVLQYVKKKNYSFDMMYAPQTLNTNAKTLNTLSRRGISSALIAKEIPLAEQVMIQEQCEIPLMIQIHGIQYVASSKRHLLSTYKEATGYSFDPQSHHLIMKPRGIDYPCHIFEDERGTHIMSESKLYMLDLFNTIKDFNYGYIETMMMSDEEALEVVSLYSDALKALDTGTYDKEVKELLPLLHKISYPYDQGFIQDSTVYKLEDMRKRDNNENGQ